MAAARSAVTRILSASAASWLRIGVTVLTQLALVPLYLAQWDAQTYGAWLLLQAVWSTVALLDLAHHDYVGYACLQLRTDQRAAIARRVFSAAPWVVLIALWDVSLAWLLSRADFVAGWVGDNGALLAQWRAALLLQALTWLATGSLGGLIVRWLTPFGYWPQFAWWGVAYAIITAAAPALAVVMGADLWHAALASNLTVLAYYLIFFVCMARIVRRGGLPLALPDFSLGLRQCGHALWLASKAVADMVRQQGSRIVLAPLAGVADMAAFATMRTGANFALQGLGTITGPIMPELMRFLVARDQARMEGAFALVWLVLCALLLPAMVIVQWLMPWLFPIWTHGKMAFDPWLFGMLSMGVAVYALAQPAAAVLMGNNVVRVQLAISLLAGLIAVGGMALAVPHLGVRGAALALLAAEAVSLGITVAIARSWLTGHGLRWPGHAFAAAAASVLCTALGLAALAATSQGQQLPVLIATLALQGVLAFVYWRQLPALARQRARAVAARFVPLAQRPALAGAPADIGPSRKDD